MRATSRLLGWPPPRRAGRLILAGFLLASAASSGSAQQPILEVRLEGVGQTLVEGRLTPEGALEFPVAPLEELIGEDLAEASFISLPALRTALGPQVEAEYDPRRALLLLRDPLATLAATRHRRESQRVEARGTPPDVFASGPYGALTADIEGERLVEGGWSLGWIAASAGHSTVSGGRWGLSVQPLPRTWLTYGDSERGDAQLGLRWAGGRTLVRSSYAPASGDLRAQAATSVGAWTAFLQDDGSAAITLRVPHSGQITVARTPDSYVARVSYGRNPSALSLPFVR